MKALVITALVIVSGIAQAESLSQSKECASSVSKLGNQIVTYHQLGTPRLVVADKYSGQVQTWALFVFDSLNRNEPKGGYTKVEYNQTVQAMVRGACY
jgi:hypothetical protein